MPKYIFLFFLFLFLLLLNSCGVLTSKIPKPRTEFRGVWIATVANIDWPKNGNDNPQKQKADFLSILDFYEKLNYNAVIVQIRAAGDALYPSELAPWSRFLTGTEGKSAIWDEDVLDWMISEAHSRGMEFHAWLNPYRATFDLKTEILSANHDYYQHPEWMVKYGNKYYYNPGLPEVQNKLVSVIDEVVSNYNVDAIHFDDYFYPYTIKDEIFKDSITYYNCSKPNQDLAAWRRSNVDSLIKKSNQAIKNSKPWVQFGISPFGVWKNNTTDPLGSDTRAGQTTYEDLYADPLLWMDKGWVDYMAPQVYWSMDLPVASYRKIVDWWSTKNNATKLYIGNAAYKVRNNGDVAWENKKELPEQIKFARELEEVSGNILFSAKSLMNKNPDVVKYLQKKYYRWSAFTPGLPGPNNTTIKIPQITASTQNNEHYLIDFVSSDQLKYALIYSSGKINKPYYPLKKLKKKIYLSQESHVVKIPKDIVAGKYFALSFLDHYGQETKPIIIQTNKIVFNDSKR
ncbi:glycoside hydrolase family 10 protein [Maribacter sp. CXY002]|uniref:glycoside hydrolase family 10 protein n=1 Tax=Maribacter luteocoastalis TaxID=3407671 RepID=UPI003B6811A8